MVDEAIGMSSILVLVPPNMLSLVGAISDAKFWKFGSGVVSGSSEYLDRLRFSRSKSLGV